MGFDVTNGRSDGDRESDRRAVVARLRVTAATAESEAERARAGRLLARIEAAKARDSRVTNQDWFVDGMR